jgi:hypothetical protein
VRTSIVLVFLAVVPVSAFASCSNGGGVAPGKDASATDVRTPLDAIPEVAPPPFDGPLPATYCNLPGSILYGAGGALSVVSGGKSGAPSLGWLKLPEGFCAHYFAHVNLARQVRPAPGGEIFVASPSTPTAGGAGSNPGSAGYGAIVVLYDDDHDGYADGDTLPHSDGSQQTFPFFKSGVASTQGMMFAPGFFYYQDTPSGGSPGTAIMRIPYKSGQRVAAGTPEKLVDVSTDNGMYASFDHWPKTLDMADDGTIYLGNGGDQSQECDSSVFPRPFLGGILKIDGTPGGTPVARGFRNPIAVRCQKGHNHCFTTELALDGSGESGGREKIVPIHQGDDWGFPCCATKNTPYADLSGSPNCASVGAETVSFLIGDTPFGLDFERNLWPGKYKNNIFATLHGAVGSWVGARVVAIPTDSNGMPIPSSDLGSSTFDDFATGWDDGRLDEGRPAALTFSDDGRVYIANDVDGDIFWIAPQSLKTKH